MPLTVRRSLAHLRRHSSSWRNARHWLDVGLGQGGMAGQLSRQGGIDQCLKWLIEASLAIGLDIRLPLCHARHARHAQMSINKHKPYTKGQL